MTISAFFNVFRKDGWSNIMTGLGRAERDKSTAAVPIPQILAGAQAEQLFRSDDIAMRVVKRPAQDMFRAGYQIKPNETGNEIEKYMRKLNANAAFVKAKILARMKGGAVIVMGIDDGLTADQPVNEKNIRGIKFLTVLDRDQIACRQRQENPALPGYGLPELYQLQTVEGSGTVIHSSRILRFDGAFLPEREFVANNYWGASVLENLWRPLQGFNTGFDSAIHLTTDFAQTVYELENLHDLIASGDDDLVQKRLALLDATRSIIRAVVIQKGENFRRESTTLTGFPELLDRISNRMVASTDMPHTLVLGEGSEGNTSGRSELEDYYNLIAQEQANDIQPKLEKLISYICVSADGPKVAFDSVSIVWNPLQQQTANEKATTYKTQAEADVLYIQNGVLDPNEVSAARFGNEDSEIPLDEANRNPNVEVPPAEKMDAGEFTIQQLIIFKAEFADAQKAGAWIAAHNYNNANIEETDNSFRFVQYPETDFVSGTMNKIKLQPGVEAIIGVLKNG